ncbi:deoxynucleoside kinase [Ammoniphilus sp. CFH 90114]|uniref:deoxynucleoside kinase n=1 Tax=Ammoniphilus sp. CFH 90114 TaxID=2493665 RepID=UPI00100E1DDE|nr:deoxynucleoside kinase [Ammoniphilus sp. CFH 90114]RXT06451.1 deoxynucleoside kinase [Ammoniphilus sp. CFH 90114]
MYQDQKNQCSPVFIAVEGPIGVGKSSLARYISEHYQFHLLNEIVEDNPFLSLFYENMEEWSLQTEMFFLFHRIKQLEDLNQTILSQGKRAVADYHIFKNRIFAQSTLQAKQYEKYDQVYQILTSDLPQPNLIIYLHASVDTLLRRISQRGRSFEQDIDPQYLIALCSRYELFMEQFQREHPETTVLHFNGDALDFVSRKEDLCLIIEQLDKALNLELKR